MAASEFERFVESAEGVHFDLIAAGDVDAAEQGDDGGHARSIRQELPVDDERGVGNGGALIRGAQFGEDFGYLAQFGEFAAAKPHGPGE